MCFAIKHFRSVVLFELKYICKSSKLKFSCIPKRCIATNVCSDSMTSTELPRYHLSFAGCGFLGIYHLGAARALAQHGGDLLDQLDGFTGASAGALVAAALAVFGFEENILQECENFCWDLVKLVKNKPLGVLTPGVSLLEPLEEFLHGLLPDDAYLLANDRLFVSVTSKRTKKNQIISNFHDNDDLVQCLLASSCIPRLTNKKPILFRNEKFIDGGLSDNLPTLPGRQIISVSPFCGNQDICPKDKPGFRWHIDVYKQNFKVNRLNIVRGLHAFFPPKQHKLQKYYTLGQQNALTFLKQEGFYTSEGPDDIIGS